MPPPPIQNPSLKHGHPTHVRAGAGGAFECDRCGRAVPRELASPGGRDDVQAVVLCADCERGAE